MDVEDGVQTIGCSDGHGSTDDRIGIQHLAARAGGCGDPCASPRHRQGPRSNVGGIVCVGGGVWVWVSA